MKDSRIFLFIYQKQKILEMAEEDENPLFLDHFPEEIIHNFIQFLSINDVTNTSLSCHHLNDIVSKCSNLWKSLAAPYKDLNSQVNSPITCPKCKNKTVSFIRKTVLEARKKLNLVNDRMRFGGNSFVERSKNFQTHGELKLVAPDTEMEKVALYYRSGLVQIYDLDTFSESEPLISFQTTTKIKKMTFLSHTLVLGPPNRNDGVCTQLWNPTTGKKYGELRYNTEDDFLGMDLNDKYVLVYTKRGLDLVMGCEWGNHDCRLRWRVLVYPRLGDGTPSNPYHFTTAEIVIPLSFHDIALKDEKMGVYNHGKLAVYNLGDPAKFPTQPMNDGMYKPEPEVLHLFPSPQRPTVDSSSESDSDSNSNSSGTTSCTDSFVYEHLYVKSPVEKMQIRPPHSIRIDESRTTFGDFVVGSYADKKQLFDITRRGSELFIYFKNCTCPICLLGRFFAPQRKYTVITELSKGFGFFYAYKSVLTLRRFDIFDESNNGPTCLGEHD